MLEQDKLFRLFPLIAAMGLVVLSVAACAVQLRPDQDSQPSPIASEENHPLAPKLESCLTVTPDQTATFEYCRRVWSENRRRFFGSQKKPPASRTAAGRANEQRPAEPAPKDQSRLPQGYPSIAAPAQE
jgi:conjugative transfer region protein TrbK